jgi:hypothetical protein
MARVEPKKTQKTWEKTVWNQRLAFLDFMEGCKLLHTFLTELCLYGFVYELPVCKSVRSATLCDLNVLGLTLADLGVVSHAHSMEAQLHT